jgi:hypothetical protein
MNLDETHSIIYQALADKAISALNEYRAVEASGQTPQVKSKMREKAVKSLRSITDYLDGEIGILPTASIMRAKELEEKEPQFIAVAEHNQALTKELLFHKDRWSRLVADGVVDDTTGIAPKPKKTAKKKAAPKKKVVAKKKVKLPKKLGKLQCGKCLRKFKSGAGLARHLKSCKG